MNEIRNRKDPKTFRWFSGYFTNWDAVDFAVMDVEGFYVRGRLAWPDTENLKLVLVFLCRLQTDLLSYQLT